MDECCGFCPAVRRGVHPEWMPPKGTETPTLRVHNTLTGELEPFTPMNGRRVKWYTCGPTVCVQASRRQQQQRRQRQRRQRRQRRAFARAAAAEAAGALACVAAAAAAAAAATADAAAAADVLTCATAASSFCSRGVALARNARRCSALARARRPARPPASNQSDNNQQTRLFYIWRQCVS